MRTTVAITKLFLKLKIAVNLKIVIELIKMTVLIFYSIQHQNFEEQMQGMKTQLIQLSTLLRLLDSGFCSYLGRCIIHAQ